VRWGNDHERAPEFTQRYARAMVARWERMADETIDIAHEFVKEDVNGHTDTGRVQQLRL
jgi:terminase small subunit-like protein